MEFTETSGKNVGVVQSFVVTMATASGQELAMANRELNVGAELDTFATTLADPDVLISRYAKWRLGRHLRSARRAHRAFWDAPPEAQARALYWYLGLGLSVRDLRQMAVILQEQESKLNSVGLCAVTMRCLRNGVVTPGRQLTSAAANARGGWGNITRQARFTRRSLLA